MTHRIKDEDIDAASPHLAIMAHLSQELARSPSRADRRTAGQLAARFNDAHGAVAAERARAEREIADREQRHAEFSSINEE